MTNLQVKAPRGAPTCGSRSSAHQVTLTWQDSEQYPSDLTKQVNRGQPKSTEVNARVVPDLYRDRLSRAWNRALDILAYTANVVLTTVLAVVAGIYYAVIGEAVHHELIAQERPNAALWWAVGYGAAGAVLLYGVLSRVSQRWGGDTR
jgi:hypothetical protein